MGVDVVIESSVRFDSSPESDEFDTLTVLLSQYALTQSLPMNKNDATQTWPELALGLYDALTGRNAEITYEFEDMHVFVPARTGGENVEHAHWKLNGVLKIRTRDLGVANG